MEIPATKTSRYNRPISLIRWHLALALLLTSGGALWASEKTVEVPEPEYINFGCDHQYTREDGMIDAAREGLDQMVCEANYWLDGLLSNHGDIDAARRAKGRLSVATTFSERTGWDFKLRLRVSVRLPTLEERFTAFIGREPDADFVAGRSEGFALRNQFPILDDDDQWLAGLGYELPSGYRIKSSFRIGARRLQDTEVFLRNRIRWNAYSDTRNLVSLRLIPFWTNEDKFGLTYGIDYAHALSRRTLLRWDTVGTQSDSTEEVDWRSAFIIYRSLSAEVGVALETYAHGDTGETESLQEYGVRALYRQPLFPGKLNLQLSVGEGWYQPPDALSRRRAYFNSSIVLQMPFGY